MTTLFGILSALACSIPPTPSPTAVAFSGEAPDDGGGIHIAIGGGPADCAAVRPFRGPYTEIGMRADLRVPSSIVLPTEIAEVRLHADAGDARVVDRGVLHLEGYDERGIRGRYAVTASGETTEGAFDASWCGPPLPLLRARAPVPLAGLDLAAHANQRVVVEGYLFEHDGRAVVASETRETLPGRPAGTIVGLDLDPALTDAVVTRGSDRMRESDDPVVIEGYVQGDRIAVTSVAPSR